jgi:hypothetical protein
MRDVIIINMKSPESNRQVETSKTRLIAVDSPMKAIYEQAAHQIGGVVIKVRPMERLEDYQRFFELQPEYEVQISPPAEEAESRLTALREIAANHFNMGSELLEITYDEDSYPGSKVDDFADEVRKLHLVWAAQHSRSAE